MKNLQKYRVDLQRLIQRGERLEVAIVFECSLEEVESIGVEEILERAERMGLCEGDDQVHIPSFKKEYQQWYSAALAVVRQLLPDRLEDFRAYYREPYSKDHSEYENYRISDYLAGYYTATDSFGTWVDMSKDTVVLELFRQQLAIVKGAPGMLASSLHKIKQLVQADLFDSELEAAKALSDSGFSRAAGVMAGVIMEKQLAQVCENYKLKLQKRHPTINDFNKILVENNAIDGSESEFIKYLGSIRNSCAHHNEGKAVTEERVTDLIKGVKKLIKTLS